MRLAENILYYLAKRWPSPMAQSHGSPPGFSKTALPDYALQKQFLEKVRTGAGFPIYGKRILEIGCGHGGIAVFLGLNGAEKVLGIDLNTANLGHAATFKKHIEERFGMASPIPVEFLEMDACQLTFESEVFDIVLADNVFEHFMAPQQVMKEAYRVLKSGGQLIVPAFNSIYSKHGLHLKHGLKMPWANVFFSERTICQVMQRLGKDNPDLYVAYPGLKNNPSKVKDLRAYGDLNSMTYRRFLNDVAASGFNLRKFQIVPPFSSSLANNLVGVLYKIPLLNRSLLADILSKKAHAVLEK